MAELGKTILYYLRQSNPIRFPEASLVQNSRWRLTRRSEIFLAGTFYALSVICAFFLFNGYATLLTPGKLLTTDILQLARTFLMPIALFTGSMYFLTAGMTLARTSVPILIMPVVFVLGTDHTTGSYIGSALVLFAFLLYYFRFSTIFAAFKKPNIANSFSISLGIFALVFSSAITISYYHSFASHTERISAALSSSVSKKFTNILSDYDQATHDSLQGETLRSRAISYLQLHNQPTDEASIRQQEGKILAALGLPTAHTTDSYQTLLDNSVKHQIATISGNYKKMIALIIPLAFFFVTNVLTNVSSLVTAGLLSISEHLLRIKVRTTLGSK